MSDYSSDNFVHFQLRKFHLSYTQGETASGSNVKLSEAIKSRDNTYLEYLDTLETQLHTLFGVCKV